MLQDVDTNKAPWFAHNPRLGRGGGDARGDSEVPTVSLHVHERIDPRTIIETVRKLCSPGGIESGGTDQIAIWLLDTNYDGRCLFPRQVFFPQAG